MEIDVISAEIDVISTEIDDVVLSSVIFCRSCIYCTDQCSEMAFCMEIDILSAEIAILSADIAVHSAYIARR